MIEEGQFDDADATNDGTNLTSRNSKMLSTDHHKMDIQPTVGNYEVSIMFILCTCTL